MTAILGVVISEEAIARQANFLHNPEGCAVQPILALEVKEQHKAALGALCSRRWRRRLAKTPESLRQPAVRKVLGDNLLLAMRGYAGRSATDYDCGEHRPSAIVSACCRVRANMCWKYEPLTVLDL